MVHVWDLATGQERMQWNAGTLVHAIAISKQGQLLAGAGDKILSADLATGKELKPLCEHKGNVWSLSFAPDGKTFASASGWDQVVRLWDSATGKELHPIGEPQGRIFNVAFAPDGKTLLTGSFEQGITLWELPAARAPRRLQGHSGKNYGFALSPDGKTLANCGEDSDIHLLDLTSGQEIRRFKGHTGSVSHLAISRDGKTLASAGSTGDTIRIWDVASGKQLRQGPKIDNWILTLAFSADGRELYWLSGRYQDGIHVYDWAADREIQHILVDKKVTQAITLSSDGKTLAAIGPGHSVQLMETASGKTRRIIEGEAGKGMSAAFSTDGRLLASADSQNVVHVWDALSGKELRSFSGQVGTIFALAFSPDGRTLASGSFDNTALLWNVSALPPRAVANLSAKDLELLWTTLADDDAAKAYDALAGLASAPQTTVAFLKQKLKPAPHQESKRIAQWAADLDSDQFTKREEASAELEKLGVIAEKALRGALQGNPSAEVRRRAEQLLEKLRRETFSGQFLRPLRALEVLERLDSAGARQLLTALAEGEPQARQTLEAKAALERLRKRDGPIP